MHIPEPLTIVLIKQTSPLTGLNDSFYAFKNLLNHLLKS